VVEGRSGNSDREMAKYYRIALKSANETKYWLCLMRDALEIKDKRLSELLNEVTEISKILGASIISISKKLKVPSQKPKE